MVCKAWSHRTQNPKRKTRRLHAHVGNNQMEQNLRGERKQSGSECGGEVIDGKDMRGKENCVGSKAGRNEGMEITPQYCRFVKPSWKRIGISPCNDRMYFLGGGWENSHYWIENVVLQAR